MTNIVMLVKDRPRLTEQCLRTLYETTPEDQFNLVIVDDGSTGDTTFCLIDHIRRKNCLVIRMWKPVSIVGWLRNVGIQASERYFGRGDWLYLSDNDVAFMPGWLDKMTDYLSFWEFPNLPSLVLLGGYRHPFHQPNDALTWGRNGLYHVDVTDAVAGYSHLMRWKTWDNYGPFDAHAKGVCQSEDFAFSQKAMKGIEAPFIETVRNMVGYMHSPVIFNCGITNSEGKPAIGADQFPRIPGLIYE